MSTIWRGSVSFRTTELELWADELDYNEETGEAEARGNVHFQHFERGEELWADRVEYNLRLETGKFYNVRGISPAKIDRRPGLLTTTNPFNFQGRWAERLKEKYILHNGFVTNCRLPKPWWTLRGPKFDIIPGQRALAYRSVFRLRFMPLFYAPVFYKSLEERPRKSGLLTPNIGNSSRRGKMVGVGYYWAINRSYDATYLAQYFTQRGFAHHVDFRAKPTAASDFNVVLFGVNDRGEKQSNGERIKKSGLILNLAGRADLGHGFTGRLEGNYVSSMPFRTSWSESYNEAIGSEVHSIGYVEKHWSGYGLSFAFARLENIQRPGDYDYTLKKYKPDDKILIRKLPEVDFVTRDRQILLGKLPIWVSLESSASLAAPEPAALPDAAVRGPRRLPAAGDDRLPLERLQPPAQLLDPRDAVWSAAASRAARSRRTSPGTPASSRWSLCRPHWRGPLTRRTGWATRSSTSSSRGRSSGTPPESRTSTSSSGSMKRNCSPTRRKRSFR